LSGKLKGASGEGGRSEARAFARGGGGEKGDFHKGREGGELSAHMIPKTQIVLGVWKTGRGKVISIIRREGK